MGKKAKKRKTAGPAAIRKLERRLAAVEARLEEAPAPHGIAGDAASPLPQSVPETPLAGGVVFEGNVDLPTGEHVERRAAAPTSGLLDDPWDGAADRLAALAHPVRVELLRHLLRGVRSTAALTDLEVVATTGQLYHHLNQLVAAGWLQHTGRGRYEVPADRVVPLLVVLAAARS